MADYNPFQKAVPVWAAGREKEMNVTCRFTAEIPEGKDTLLRMTGSTVYRVYVNGNIVAYGPARGPKTWFRVDEFSLAPYLTKDKNLVLFEVAGYNINDYYTMDQPSFFQAEIIAGNEVIAYTAPVGGMPCDIVTERVQKTQKYSFQRAFTEAWRLGPAYAKSFDRMTDGRTPLVRVEDKQLLPRRVPFPHLPRLAAMELVGSGTVSVDDKPAAYQDRSLVGISAEQKGYRADELEVRLSDDAGHYEYVLDKVTRRPILVDEVMKIEKDHFVSVKLASDLTGFIGARVHADKPASVLFLFDEIFEGDVNIWRMGCVNIVRFDIQPGDYNLLSMEPYTMQYVKIVVFGADVTVSDIHLTEYAAPDDNFVSYTSDNPKFMKIWDAAVQTYRQNAVDLYTDCPCRERAGWLCDSFWTSRVEYALTGKSIVEKNFLENFLLPESFECLPKGMFPMCYPSDHYNHNYIPNWAMWLVMEVREYLDRSGDRELIDAFRDKFYALVEFLDGYLNEDGLLEKLDQWVFVEWSKANELVQDVNFPSNMLYAACLEAMAEMYGDEALQLRADAMRETIRRLSFNGKFFTDNMVRDADGVLVNPNEATEVCQYYAFYLKTATPELYPILWKTLVEEFGPFRKGNNKYPEIYFANAFIGNYLRLDMMAKNGNMKEVLDNIEGYFYNMALMTGTLWENDSTVASLDHGFASHVIVWLLNAQK